MPLDAVDLQHVSLLYTQGEMAAVAPIYDYDFKILTETMTESSWRQLLFWLGPPGIVIGALALFTLREPRTAKPPASKKPFLGGALKLPFMTGVPPEPTPPGAQHSSTGSTPAGEEKNYIHLVLRHLSLPRTCCDGICLLYLLSCALQYARLHAVLS